MDDSIPGELRHSPMTRASPSVAAARPRPAANASSTGCSAPSAASTTTPSISPSKSPMTPAAGRRLLRWHLELSSRQSPPLRLPQPGAARHRSRPRRAQHRLRPAPSPAQSHRQFFADVHAAISSATKIRCASRNAGAGTSPRASPSPSGPSTPTWWCPRSSSRKPQYGAYTMRPRLYRLLPDFLSLRKPSADQRWHKPQNFHAESVARGHHPRLEGSRPQRRPVAEWDGGPHAALARLKHFTASCSKTTSRERNHPEIDGTSKLSPYLHFGHIGPLTIALAVDAAAKKTRASNPPATATSTS